MSRANIVRMIPTESGELLVVFALRDGETATYKYDAISSVAILGGADPKNFAGERVD